MSKNSNNGDEGKTSQLRQRKNVGGSQEQAKKDDGNEGSTNKLVNAPDSAGGASFFQKLLKRIIVGFVLISGFAGIVLSDHLYVSLLVIVVQAVVYKEIISLRFKTEEVKVKKIPWFRTMNWYFFFVSLVYVYGDTFVQYLNPFIPTQIYGFLTQYHMSISFSLYVVGEK